MRATVGTRAGALLVPQRAVIDTQGTYTVAVVDAGNIVRFTRVLLGDTLGSNWIVEQGLKPGELVVTEGLFHIRPGAKVNPKGNK